ncbi:hypothetical protein BJV78DRAFT_1347422 [Lactifluus subvellereus]|nr:hypothetical protein BJV78DRAFT_1347422 [Lactifluus subvellereus]
MLLNCVEPLPFDEAAASVNARRTVQAGISAKNRVPIPDNPAVSDVPHFCPLPPPSKLLNHNLTPDPATPSISAFKYALRNNPSIQRRGRIISPEAHFSHIEPPEDPPEPFDKEEYALNLAEPAEQTGSGGNEPLQKLYPAYRSNPMEFLGLSDTGLRDCLPHLDVGDAFEVVGEPSPLGQTGLHWQERQHPEDSKAVATRQGLIDVLGGHAMLISGDESDVSFAPWSLRYSGHHFGAWAGQLGDGRAISIHATPHPSDPETTYELQVKGAGRTPFSRRADGLAVIRSSIREYLCAEAMNALGIPTTRSLSIIYLLSISVIRERRESACIVTRVAPSFLRIGSFEALNPPKELFLFGGGQQPADLDACWANGSLIRCCISKHLKEAHGDARRNARMVAGWRAYGFMHGVINTDDKTLCHYDPMHICNHTDEEGRYAYKVGSLECPSVIDDDIILALLNALAPLVGAEAELGNKAVTAEWAKEGKKDEWSDRGVALVEEELEDLFRREYEVEFHARMRQRLGLRRAEEKDNAALVQPLFVMLADHKLDFHLTFRHLARFRPALSSPLDPFVDALLRYTSTGEAPQLDGASEQWKSWLEKYAARIESEKEKWGGTNSEGADWQARRGKEVIAKVEADAQNGRHVLAKVMQMACDPYEPWGGEGDTRTDEKLDAETKEEI